MLRLNISELCILEKLILEYLYAQKREILDEKTVYMDVVLI